jgi:hypothetical protein
MADLRELMAALTTPVLGALGIWIAYQQYRTQRFALRRDLIQQRLAVLNAVRDLLREGCNKQRPDIDAVNQFSLATVAAPFLFGPEVEQYLDEVRKKFVDVWDLADRHADEAFHGDGDRDQALAKKREYVAWMRSQFKAVEQVFKKYLDLSRA